MANAPWTFRLDSAVASGTMIQIGVSYYDATDTGFANQLYSTTFSYSADTPNGDIRAEIIGSGQLARRAQDKAAAILAQFPIGTTGSVP